MRSLLTLMLAAAMLPALSQAQTVNICDRTPEVRDAIMQALEKDDCAASNSEGLTSVEELVIGNKQLTALRAGDFDGLTGLEYLDLSSNQLTVLPEGVFAELTSLEYLALGGNQLTALPQGVFDGLASLEGLDLQHNHLTALPEGVFDGLTSLQRLHLSNNLLSALPEGVFDGFTIMEELHLNNNHLVGLTPNDPLFAGLRFRGRFQETAGLWLGGQIPASQAVNICDRTPQVRDAIMRRVGHIGRERHSGFCAAVDSVALASLEELYIGSEHSTAEQLTALRAGDFDGLTGLKELVLNNNQLTTLPQGVFDGLTSLEGLYLGWNQLTALPAGVFDGLTSLQRLNLQNNHLVDLTENDPSFAALPSGIYLNLCCQNAAPGEPTQPEPPTPPKEPEQPEEPDAPSNDLAALQTRMAALEASMTALAAAMALQQTTLEATNAMLQDIANRVSALEQREPEVRTSTRFIPVPVE